MDTETVRMLKDLPDDLRIRGWTLSASESAVTKKKPLRYRVVYVRPVDDRLDAEDCEVYATGCSPLHLLR